MPCFHPLPAIKNPYSKNRPVRVGKQGDSFEAFTDIITGEYIEPFTIPCGRCLGCRLDYSRHWANRCVMETIVSDRDMKNCTSEKWSQNRNIEIGTWFITLTYDNFHLPYGSIKEDGSSLPTLCREHIEKFIKNLRRHWQYHHGIDANIRYYISGEYGDRSFRPHYHLIVWNLPIYDLEHYSRSALGDELCNSKEINDIWKKGFVVIARSSWNTCAYVARYTMKKQGVKSSEYNETFLNAGIETEFCRMSRGHGIGLQFYEENKDKIYLHDSIVLPAKRKGETFAVKPPRIFDTKYGEEFPRIMADIKAKRAIAMQIAEKNLLRQTDLDMIEYFYNAEEKKKKEIQSLRRIL